MYLFLQKAVIHMKLSYYNHHVYKYLPFKYKMCFQKAINVPTFPLPKYMIGTFGNYALGYSGFVSLSP